MATEQQILDEISRLQSAISRQTQQQTRSTPQQSYQPRGRAYYRGRGSSIASIPRNVVIDGVTFQASGRSLVRKNDVNDPSTTLHNATPAGLPPVASTSATTMTPQTVTSSPASSIASSGPLSSTTTTHLSSNTMIRTKKGTLVAANRLKTHHRSSPSAVPQSSQPFNSRRGVIRGRGRGMTRGVRSQRVQQSRFKLANRQPIDKPCREFTRRGVCLNGLRCRYKHNPDQVAICPKYLSDDCSLPEGTCPLSHDPTPCRVPVCVHFANGARCRNGSACKFPHVRLGPKQGVCRDFAVLGFCAKGLECEHQHVRECPDFAATGACPTKGCRLPHVIRAQHKKKSEPLHDAPLIVDTLDHVDRTGTGQVGDDFISLTFNESDDETAEDEEEEEEAEDVEDDDEMADGVQEEDLGDLESVEM